MDDVPRWSPRCPVDLVRQPMELVSQPSRNLDYVSQPIPWFHLLDTVSHLPFPPGLSKLGYAPSGCIPKSKPDLRKHAELKDPQTALQNLLLPQVLRDTTTLVTSPLGKFDGVRW